MLLSAELQLDDLKVLQKHSRVRKRLAKRSVFLSAILTRTYAKERLITRLVLTNETMYFLRRRFLCCGTGLSFSDSYTVKEIAEVTLGYDNSSLIIHMIENDDIMLHIGFAEKPTISFKSRPGLPQTPELYADWNIEESQYIMPRQPGKIQKTKLNLLVDALKKIYYLINNKFLKVYKIRNRELEFEEFFERKLFKKRNSVRGYGETLESNRTLDEDRPKDFGRSSSYPALELEKLNLTPFNIIFQNTNRNSPIIELSECREIDYLGHDEWGKQDLIVDIEDRQWVRRRIDMNRLEKVFGLSPKTIQENFSIYMQLSDFLPIVPLAGLRGHTVEIYSSYFNTPLRMLFDLYPLEETEIRFIASILAAQIEDVHRKHVTIGILHPWMIRLDTYGVPYLDIIWCLTRGLKFCSFEEINPKYRPYIAPEVEESHSFQHCSDWWAFGAILYELLFGVSPYYHYSMEKMAKLKKNPPLIPQKSLRSDSVKDLVAKLLQPNVTDRLGWKKGLPEIKSHPWFSHPMEGDKELEWKNYGIKGFRVLNIDYVKTPYKSSIEDFERAEEDFMNSLMKESNRATSHHIPFVRNGNLTPTIFLKRQQSFYE